MKRNTLVLIFILLLFGILYKLVLTSDGNFIFNMDNARDMVDIREMVVLKQPRLIGPTSGIEGFFNGPGWYYLLAIPYLITSGNPYGSILLMIFLWALGGFFLMKLLSRFGNLVILTGGMLWISSNYVNLATLYSFNPNPVILLTPLFIFLLEKYLIKNTLYYGIGVWFFGGLFFNFEMAFGVFIPVIVILSLLLSGKRWFFKEKSFLIGFIFFILALLPQILFELRHNFFMIKSVANYLRNTHAKPYSIIGRFETVKGIYLSTLSGTLMNWEIFTRLSIVAFFIVLFKFFKEKFFVGDKLLLITTLFLLIPPFIHILLPINVMPWHLGGTMAAAILFIGIILGKLLKMGILGRSTVYILAIVITIYAFNNLELGKNLFDKKTSSDAAVFANEIRAVDYVYKEAQGKNFRVYVYLPSVIDYPYQYLFWWHGLGKYGYLPKDYAYLPDKPEYISNKNKLQRGSNPEDSGLTFLIKQPDAILQRHLWENSFSKLPLLKSENIGPLIIETRKQIP